MAERRAAWLETARQAQLPPNGDWRYWLYQAGRGGGKTRAAAEDTAWFAFRNPHTICGVAAPTSSDLRRVVFEGESGLLACLPPEVLRKGSVDEGYNRSMSEIHLDNGSVIIGIPAFEPQRFRGPQFHRFWGDEIGAWDYLSEALDLIRPAVRLGRDPRIILTTTPRPSGAYKALLKDRRAVLTRGSTRDNAANLPVAFLADLHDRYAGTRYERQELMGDYLEDVPGSLFAPYWIELHRVFAQPCQMARIVVAVDPSGAANEQDEDADEIGIVVGGRGIDKRGYVLQDATMRGSPDQWGKRVVEMYVEHKADCIVAEKNYGGEMVRATIHNAARNIKEGVNVKLITATRGKVVRAEPVSAIYEQGRVSHVGIFTKLEDQLALFTGSGYTGEGSPDRADALIWAMTELMNAGAMTPDHAVFAAGDRGMMATAPLGRLPR